MKLEYNEKGVPMMVIEKPDARITITFAEKPRNPKLKDSILEMLSAAYENTVVHRTA